MSESQQAPSDRGCRWCQARPGEWCEYDCGAPAPVRHPDNQPDADNE